MSLAYTYEPTAETRGYVPDLKDVPLYPDHDVTHQVIEYARLEGVYYFDDAVRTAAGFRFRATEAPGDLVFDAVDVWTTIIDEWPDETYILRFIKN